MSAGIVTTARQTSRELVRLARDVAARCGLRFEPRSGVPPEPSVVVSGQGARLYLPGMSVPSHPGMGLVRVRRDVRGEGDPLLRLAAFRPGERVLDCTFGFGHDALVIAHAVGEQGRVVGLEASALLAALALGGLRGWPAPADELVGRIEVRHAEHLAFLRAQPDGSFDVVFLDPMFRQPKAAAPGFDVLRALAEPAPPSAEVVAQARRVARRLVVMKDAWPGEELRRLGFETEPPSRRGDVIHGWMPAAERFAGTPEARSALI